MWGLSIFASLDVFMRLSFVCSCCFLGKIHCYDFLRSLTCLSDCLDTAGLLSYPDFHFFIWFTRAPGAVVLVVLIVKSLFHDPND